MSAFGQAGFGSKNRQSQLRLQGQMDPYGQQVRQAMQPPTLNIYQAPQASMAAQTGGTAQTAPVTMTAQTGGMGQTRPVTPGTAQPIPSQSQGTPPLEFSSVPDAFMQANPGARPGAAQGIQPPSQGTPWTSLESLPLEFSSVPDAFMQANLQPSPRPAAPASMQAQTGGMGQTAPTATTSAQTGGMGQTRPVTPGTAQPIPSQSQGTRYGDAQSRPTAAEMNPGNPAYGMDGTALAKAAAQYHQAGQPVPQWIKDAAAGLQHKDLKSAYDARYIDPQMWSSASEAERAQFLMMRNPDGSPMIGADGRAVIPGQQPTTMYVGSDNQLTPIRPSDPTAPLINPGPRPASPGTAQPIQPQSQGEMSRWSGNSGQFIFGPGDTLPAGATGNERYGDPTTWRRSDAPPLPQASRQSWSEVQNFINNHPLQVDQQWSEMATAARNRWYLNLRLKQERAGEAMPEGAELEALWNAEWQRTEPAMTAAWQNNIRSQNQMASMYQAWNDHNEARVADPSLPAMQNPDLQQGAGTAQPIQPQLQGTPYGAQQTFSEYARQQLGRLHSSDTPISAPTYEPPYDPSMPGFDSWNEAQSRRRDEWAAHTARAQREASMPAGERPAYSTFDNITGPDGRPIAEYLENERSLVPAGVSQEDWNWYLDFLERKAAWSSAREPTPQQLSPRYAPEQGWWNNENPGYGRLDPWASVAGLRNSLFRAGDYEVTDNGFRTNRNADTERAMAIRNFDPLVSGLSNRYGLGPRPSNVAPDVIGRAWRPQDFSYLDG